MIRQLHYLGLLLPLFTTSSWAAEQNSSVHIAPAGSHTAVYGSAENFIGRVRVDPLFNADNDIRVSAAYVTFEPGARSAWHTHPAGQRLIVTSGVGLTQQEVLKTVLKMLAICMMAGGLGVQSVYAEPLVIQEQGSFSAGGTIITAPGTFDAKKPLDSAGQTYHGDHASVFYQIPENPHKYPIVMLHGAGQSSRTWESTPDGREGFQNIFLRRGFSTYIVDQPRRGDAGRTTVEGTVTPKPDEQMWFNQFRVGVWPDYFKGVQFSHDKEALNQYFRQMTPNTGPFDVNVISDAMSAVVDKSGPAILFTHSQGGGPGWYTAMKNNKVKAIVAFEPGSGFVFPEKELPAPMPSAFDTLKGEPVPMEQFMALTKIPILIIYGDNIPDKPVAMPAQDSWRVRLAMARKWRDVVNKHGGDVTVTHLPEVGIKGNTHFPFTDLNNVQIADLVSRFLKEKNLQ